MSAAQPDRCKGCRRGDIAVFLSGPRNGRIPVCFVCWARCSAPCESEKAIAKQDAFYVELGATPPTRRHVAPQPAVIGTA